MHFRVFEYYLGVILQITCGVLSFYTLDMPTAFIGLHLSIFKIKIKHLFVAE